jgi:hypothetical protein
LLPAPLAIHGRSVWFPAEMLPWLLAALTLTAAFVDDDEFLSRKIINNHPIEASNRHLGNTESVAATGDYTRR